MKEKYEQYLENYFTNFVKHISRMYFEFATYGIDTHCFGHCFMIM